MNKGGGVNMNCMKQLTKFFLLVGVLSFVCLDNASAEEKEYQSEAGIGFYGEYVPVDSEPDAPIPVKPEEDSQQKPKPEPKVTKVMNPSQIEKKATTLPKTGTEETKQLRLVGTSIILFGGVMMLIQYKSKLKKEYDYEK